MLEQLFIGSFIAAIVFLIIAVYRNFKINKQNKISHQISDRE